MKAMMSKIEIAIVAAVFVAAGTIGTIWMLKAINGALFACAAASESPCSFI